MKLIENITDAEIRVNMQRQANNLSDQVETCEAVGALVEMDRVVPVITPRTVKKMRAVVRNEEKIVSAVQRKIDLFREIIAGFEEARPNEDGDEYTVSDMLVEASAENEMN